MTALAFAEVSFSDVRVGFDLESCLSKKAWKPSGIVFGEQGGVSGKSPPYDVGLLRGEICSDERMPLKLVAANGRNGELLSGSVSYHAGLAGSYSLWMGAGILTNGRAGCAGSYGLIFDTGNGGLDGSSGSDKRFSANGDELPPSSMSVEGLDK